MRAMRVFCCRVTFLRESTPSARKIARTSVFIKADLLDVIDAFVSGFRIALSERRLYAHLCGQS